MFKILKSLSTLIDKVNSSIGGLCSWLVLLMIVIGAWNVVGRYLGRFVGANLSSNTLLELQWQLFAAVFLLGAAYTLKQNEHVRVDVFYKDLDVKKKAIANLIGTVLFLFPFSITVITVSSKAVWNSCAIWEISPNPGGLPLCPAKSLIIIGFLLLVLQGISEAAKNWAILRAPSLQENHHD
ncbi:MAG: TRAP transporter small permease subunit [Thermosynechococcaceae cyanobacterium]